MKLAVDAELRKLAEELACDPSDLEFLSRFSPDELEQMRHVIYHALDEKFRPVFQNIERAARLVPTRLTVAIAMRHFSPMVLGRTSTELTSGRALKLLPLIPTEFIADCAPFMDPERARPMVGELPMDVMMPVVEEVIRRGDHVAMGRLLGALHHDHIAEVAPVVEDGRDLILIGFHCEERSVLEPLIMALTDTQVAATVAAATAHDLEAELEYVLGHIGTHARQRLLDAAPEGLRQRLEAG